MEVIEGKKFMVYWSIPVYARSAKEAAEIALKVQRKQDMDTTLIVEDEDDTDNTETFNTSDLETQTS
jgi:hypothetical protein